MLASNVNLLGHSRPYLRAKEVKSDGRTSPNGFVEILPFEYDEENTRGEDWRDNMLVERMNKPEKDKLIIRDHPNITMSLQGGNIGGNDSDIIKGGILKEGPLGNTSGVQHKEIQHNTY